LQFQTHKATVPLFLEEMKVPFTNSEAERDPEMTEVRQKISGRFRIEAGAGDFCTLLTVIGTALKQGWEMLQTMIIASDRPILDLKMG